MVSSSLGEGFFDSSNRLTSFNTTSYDYDVENIRVKKCIGETITEYTHNANSKLSQLLMKTENGVTTYYIYGLGLIYETTDTDCKVYHYDYRGSTVALTDLTGDVTDTFTYDTYGKLTARTGTTATPFLYNGRDGVMTDENGLVYMRARYYSPTLKRFINADVVAGSITNAITLNRYAYANGNPVSNVDPRGMEAEKKYHPYPSQTTESTIEMREDDFIYVPADDSSEFGYIKYNNELYPIKYLDYSNGQSYLVSVGYTIAQYHERSLEFDWVKAVTGYMPNELPSPDERAIFSNNGNNNYAVQAPGIGKNRISSALISGGVAATNFLSFIQNGHYGVNLVVKVSADSSNNKRASVGVYVDYLALEYPAIPNSIVTKTTDVDYFGVNEEGHLFSVYNNSSRK